MSDCVGCGYCCLKVQCFASMVIHGPAPRCPALVWDGQRYRCQHADALADDLAIGAGCSSALMNTWRHDVKERG